MLFPCPAEGKVWGPVLVPTALQLLYTSLNLRLIGCCRYGPQNSGRQSSSSAAEHIGSADPAMASGCDMDKVNTSHPPPLSTFTPAIDAEFSQGADERLEGPRLKAFLALLTNMQLSLQVNDGSAFLY